MVTGASSGLGATMAGVLASAGADVLIVARRAERLETLAAELQDCEGTVHTFSADLSDSSAIASLAEESQNQLGGCDILVANAGTANRFRLETMSEEGSQPQSTMAASQGPLPATVSFSRRPHRQYRLNLRPRRLRGQRPRRLYGQQTRPCRPDANTSGRMGTTRYHRQRYRPQLFFDRVDRSRP